MSTRIVAVDSGRETNAPPGYRSDPPMTTVSRSFRQSSSRPEDPPPTAPRPPIDVRCASALPDRSTEEGRCQLFAGHDGPHAIMFGRSGERTIRTWPKGSPEAAEDLVGGGLQRPWGVGFPAPAWFEVDPPSRLTS
jgi:hypothetical protein